MSNVFQMIGEMSKDEYEEFLKDMNEPWKVREPVVEIDGVALVTFEKVSLVEFKGCEAKPLGLFTVGRVNDDCAMLTDADGVTRVVFFEDEDYAFETVEDYKARGL